MDKVFRLIYGNFNHVYRALGPCLRAKIDND